MEQCGEIIINKPSESTFKYYNDPAYRSLWQVNLDSSELIEGEAGKVGSKYKQVYKVNQKGEDIIEEIVDIEENKNVTKVARHKTLDVRMITYFDEVDGKTKVTSMFEVTPKNISINLLLPGVRELIKTTQSKSFEKLKQLVETH